MGQQQTKGGCIVIFKDLSIGASFTMTGTSFSMGRTYRKLSARTYQQIDRTGGLMGPVYRIGTIRCEVQA